MTTLNVIDFGADPTGIADSAPAFQNCFNTAFGSAASPHGLAGATSNLPVYIPNGQYKLNSTLVLTRVVGGHIWGAASASTRLSGPGGGNAVIRTNGCTNLIMERLWLNVGDRSITGNIGIDLDWDNSSGGDGLHQNTFNDVNIENANIGIRIAHSGFEGYNNCFQNVALSTVVTGIDVQSATAHTNMTVGGGGQQYSGQLYWNSAGQLHVMEPSIGLSSTTTGYALRLDSGLPCAFIGGRVESNDKCFKVSSGLLTIKCFNMALGTEFLTMSGGKVLMDSCLTSNGSLGQINGTGGVLYMRGCAGGSFNTTGFSGTIAENL